LPSSFLYQTWLKAEQKCNCIVLFPLPLLCSRMSFSGCVSIYLTVRTLCSNQAESSPFTKWVGSTSPAQPQSCGLSSSSVPMCNFQPLSEISCFSQDLILSAFLRTIPKDNRYRSLLFSSRQTARSIHYHLPEMEQWTDKFSSPLLRPHFSFLCFFGGGGNGFEIGISYSSSSTSPPFNNALPA
jgi:hypothetical protein